MTTALNQPFLFNPRTYEHGHGYLFDVVQEELAYDWLSRLDAKRLRAILREHTSYGIKHLCEDEVRYYISNDSMVAAMVRFGLVFAEDKPFYNPYFKLPR
jgi:hypothetical protein